MNCPVILLVPLESLSQAFTELPSTIDALNAILNIGFILANKADGILALECFGRALAGFERVHMSDEIVLALKGMAEISEEQGDCKSALDYYIRLLEVLEEE
jgi:tetratricopeptide (TPR) repeat protein